MKITLNGTEVKLSSLNGTPVWVDIQNELNVIAKAEDAKVEYDIKEEQDFIGNKLFVARLEKGWTMDYLVSISGISKASINGYEKGEIKPTIKNLAILEYLLGVKVFA